MTRQVLILHGWSDDSRSFEPLAAFLAAAGYAPRGIWLGDYVSKDDDLRVEDVATRMAQAIDDMIARGVLDPGFDMIVHSTGALVARSWLTTRHRGDAARGPLKRLVMLAPANHGAKLAAAGKSLLGRVVKGYDNWFESGQAMLDDLELASPFQWDLARRDLLVAPGADPGPRYYGADLVWPFVIVGTHPYADRLRRITNEDGGDGTVRVCAANLDALGATIDFGADRPVLQRWASRLECDVPLAVLPTRTHGSIVDPQRILPASRERIAETDAEMAVLGDLILEALACDRFGSYRDIGARWHARSEATAARRAAPPPGARAEFFHQYLQVNVEARDDHGRKVPDYFLEFFSDPRTADDDGDVYLHASVLEDVKTNTRDPSLRNLFFDRTDLMDGHYAALPPGATRALRMSVSAASPGRNVAYFASEKTGAKGDVVLHLGDGGAARWLRRNTTHYVRIVVPRRPARRVFGLRRLAPEA